MWYKACVLHGQPIPFTPQTSNQDCPNRQSGFAREIYEENGQVTPLFSSNDSTHSLLRMRSHRGRTAIQEARSRRWSISGHETALEAENKSNAGFIVLESLEEDEHGILTTRARTNKRKTSRKNQPKTRKEFQKAKYSFSQSSAGTSLYADYFNPDIEVEWRVMGLFANVRISFFLNEPALTCG